MTTRERIRVLEERGTATERRLAGVVESVAAAVEAVRLRVSALETARKPIEYRSRANAGDPCEGCVHEGNGYDTQPCKGCWPSPFAWPDWAAKPERDCDTCAHRLDNSCCGAPGGSGDCLTRSAWEPKGPECKCSTCAYGREGRPCSAPEGATGCFCGSAWVPSKDDRI